MIQRISLLLSALLLSMPLSALAQTDALTFGHSKSESSHRFEARLSITEIGLAGAASRRLLPDADLRWKGGEISFELKVDPVAQNYVTIQFSGDEPSPGRLYMTIDGELLGYLHLGDHDILEPGTSGAILPGRFIYRTTPLPEHKTSGKTTVRLCIHATGPIWAYGENFDRFQREMTQPSRAIYQAISHTDPAYLPPEYATGTAPREDRIRSAPGAEVLDQVRARIEREISRQLTGKQPLHQMQLLFLAEAWWTPWTTAHRNPAVIERVLASLDAFLVAAQENPDLITKDPVTLNPGWFGVGPIGRTLHLLQSELSASLDLPVPSLEPLRTRRVALEEILTKSRTWNAMNRRLYTNQSMIKDLYGIYLCNAGLRAIDSKQTWPETRALRYLRESVGIEPWLGSDSEDGTPTRSQGDGYYQITESGLTRELGYVGSYGEVLDWVARIYEATRPSPGQAGDAAILDQLRKIALARAAFRHPAVDDEGYRAMRLASFVGWRDHKYPGPVVYAQKSSRDGSALEVAAATMDSQLIGFVQQMFRDNQFFASVVETMSENGGLRITHGLLGLPDAYTRLKAIPETGQLLPMVRDRYVFTDEQNGVVAVRDGTDILYASLYWRARHAVNNLAAVEWITPDFVNQAIVRQESRFTPSGLTWRRPSTVVFGFGNGGSHIKYPVRLPPSAHAGETLPIAKIPEGIPYRTGQEHRLAGKADFYLLRYGPFLIAMNTSETREESFHLPPEFVGARELTATGTVPRSGSLKLSPRSTLILRRAER